MQTKDEATIEYYNKNLNSYVERTFNVKMDEIRRRFLRHLPKNAKILDAGCGPGRDALAFHLQGYNVLGFDAAHQMVKYVNEELKIPAVQGYFQDMQFSNEFDGIWASASLVHVAPNDLKEVLHRFQKALKPAGVLAISFKYGEGVKTEGERTFTYMTEKSLSPYLEEFTLLDQWIQVPEEGVNLVPCKWLNTVLRKKEE